MINETLNIGEPGLRAILETSQDGILIEEGETIVFVNQAYLELFGFEDSSELLGRQVSAVIAPQDVDRVLGYGRERVNNAGPPAKYEFSGIRRDGSLLKVEAFVSLVGSEDHVYIITFLRDISDRKRFENLLAAQKQALELVVNGTPLPNVLSLLALAVEQQCFSEAFCSILLVDEDGLLRNGASPNLPESYLKAIDGFQPEVEIGTCSSAAATGTTVITPVIALDPKWALIKHLPLEHGFQAAWSMPIFARDGHVLGTIGTYFREARPPRQFERELVEFLAPTAAVAIERSRADDARSRWNSELESRVALRTGELQRLVGKMVSVQEEERRRIAADLHDQLGQQMTVLRIKVESISNSLGLEAGAHEQVHDLMNFARQLSEDVSFLAWELRPSVLDDLGIVAAIDQYVFRWSNQFGIGANFNSKNFDHARLNSQIETNFYRIAQEALNNVAKHAQATKVDVLLESRSQETVLIVEDDGIGFEDGHSVSANDGMGLSGIRERVDLLMGKFEIESGEGTGTTLFVTIPHPIEGEVA